MPRTPEQNRVIKDKRKNKMIDFAIRSFASQGYKAVSIDTITKAAKCSHGLFYHYFDSKEDVYSYLIDEIIPSSPLALSLDDLGEKTGTEAIKEIGQIYSAMNKASTKDLLITAILLQSYSDTDVPSYIAKKTKKYNLEKNLTELVTKAQAEGNAISGEPASIAKAISTIISKEISENVKSKAKGNLTSGDIIVGFLMKKPLTEI